MQIRPIHTNEIVLLTEFIYEAIYQPNAENLISRTIIQDPKIWIYIDEFGSKKDDYCLVAEVEGFIVGAVWVRCIPAFGYIEDSVPEFAISVYSKYRGKGIGTEMMKEMISLLKGKGYTKTSLAVQKNNPAVNLYKKVGFTIYDENEQEYIMIYNLN